MSGPHSETRKGGVADGRATVRKGDHARPRSTVLRWIGDGLLLLLVAIGHASGRRGRSADSEPASKADWMKLFDDGTARLGRSLVLLVGAGFGMVSREVLIPRREEVCADESVMSVACGAMGFLQGVVTVSIVILLTFFVVQFVIAAPCYVAAARRLVEGTKCRRFAGLAGTSMMVACGFAAVTMLTGFVLLADGTIGGAVLHAARGSTGPTP